MTDAKLVVLLDKDAIRDCIHRYCRGIDRADEAALGSSYSPDAHDSHGAYSGPVSGFIERSYHGNRLGSKNLVQTAPPAQVYQPFQRPVNSGSLFSKKAIRASFALSVWASAIVSFCFIR